MSKCFVIWRFRLNQLILVKSIFFAALRIFKVTIFSFDLISLKILFFCLSVLFELAILSCDLFLFSFFL